MSISPGPTARLNRPLLLLGLVALLGGIWAGLLRIGWAWPALPIALPKDHGPLMVSSFLGTVICLERAVALSAILQGRGRWAVYAPAIFSAVGGLLLLAGLWPWPVLLLTLGSVGLVALAVRILRLHPAVHAAVMLVGALLWVAGNLFWLAGWPMAEVAMWWIGFLLLTITGERLELNRILVLSPSIKLSLLVAIAVFAAGVLAGVADYALGMAMMGLGMALVAVWLLVHDIARRRLRVPGQARFVAICLVTGYVWLGVAGLLALIYGGVAAGPAYDAILHSFFLGFVFNLIFGHAPIVFPAVTGRRMSFSPLFYSHVLLLNLSLLLRLYGDLTLGFEARRWGGLLNAVALLLFLANTILALVRSVQPDRPRS